MRDFLLLQLIFNVLILVSLMVLARGVPAGRRRKQPAARRGRSGRPAEAGGRPAEPSPAPAGHLSELIEQTERKELLAEAALRERLSEFRARVAG